MRRKIELLLLTILPFICGIGCFILLVRYFTSNESSMHPILLFLYVIVGISTAISNFRELILIIKNEKSIDSDLSSNMNKGYPMTLETIPEETLEMIKRIKEDEDDIKAVKKVRELTGAGLLEAKQFVDTLYIKIK